MSLKISHYAGFFSCCSVMLYTLIEYYNKHHELPKEIDTVDLFDWYKKENKHISIYNDYFRKHNDNVLNNYSIQWEGNNINYHHEHQFSDYKNLDYRNLNVFINKYFYPSDMIRSLVLILEYKYINNKYSYDNLCVLFYRGNDKVTETNLTNYQEYITKAREFLVENPNIIFLIQSDETEFIEVMTKEFPNSFYFKDEIRHMNKINSTVDVVFSDKNNEFSKYYLAITIIMGKCKYIICQSGNCSIWIMLFRNHANNIKQFLHDRWL